MRWVMDDFQIARFGSPSSCRELKTRAQELLATIRRNVTIDWTIRDDVRTQLRVLVNKQVTTKTA